MSENKKNMISDVANNLINKIANGIGYCVVPKGTNKYQIEAMKPIIDEIAKREDINPIERAAIISNYRQIIKEYKNQNDILQIALDNLKPDAKIENLEEEWLSMFFDYAKKVSSLDLQTIWARLLLEQSNGDSKVPKMLLNSVHMMERSDMETFLKLVQFCFFNSDDDIRAYSCIYLSDKPSYYNKLGIYRHSMVSLQNFGLVEVKWNDEFVFPKQINKIRYGDKELVVNGSDKRAYYGNVRLTSLGAILAQMIDKSTIPHDHLEFCISIWNKRKYTFEIMK